MLDYPESKSVKPQLHRIRRFCRLRRAQQTLPQQFVAMLEDFVWKVQGHGHMT